MPIMDSFSLLLESQRRMAGLHLSQHLAEDLQLARDAKGMRHSSGNKIFLFQKSNWEYLFVSLWKDCSQETKLLCL